MEEEIFRGSFSAIFPDVTNLYFLVDFALDKFYNLLKCVSVP